MQKCLAEITLRYILRGISFSFFTDIFASTLETKWKQKEDDVEIKRLSASLDP